MTVNYSVSDGIASTPTSITWTVLGADEVVQTVLATGRATEFAAREKLMVKRSLVNGSQRLELTGWGAARLDWYKAQGCFTEIIRYKTRLFVPIDSAASVIARLTSLA